MDYPAYMSKLNDSNQLELTALFYQQLFIKFFNYQNIIIILITWCIIVSNGYKIHSSNSFVKRVEFKQYVTFFKLLI